MRTPAALLAELLASDAASPRVTCYDDTPGPTAGERVELSGRVLANWVAKIGNLLQDEADVGPGEVVALDLPAHWRAVAWAFGVWAVGGCVALGPVEGAAVTVSTDPDTAAAGAADGGLGVLVTLPALARSAEGPVPAGVVDEAAQLPSYPDRLEPAAVPDAADPALRGGGRTHAYAQVVPGPRWPENVRVHLTSPSLAETLETALAAFAHTGSLVLSRGPVDRDTVLTRVHEEGITLAL